MNLSITKKFAIVLLVITFGITFSACDFLNDNDTPDMVTVTFEAADGSSWVYEDIEIDGVNYGDDLPITTDLETGTYHVSWVNTIGGGTSSGTIEVDEEGQTFILDHGDIYEQ